MSSRYSSFNVEGQSQAVTPFKRFSRVSNYIASCFMCLFCVMNIVFLIIVLSKHSFTFHPKFTELMPFVDYIAVNLRTSPIMNIALADIYKNCPSDYTLLTLAAWPGTTTGCFCPNTGKIYSGQCVRADLKDCHVVNPVPIQLIDIWNTESYCIRRILHTNYSFKTYEANCPEGDVDCGEICVKEELFCPITSLSIVGSETVNSNDQEDETESIELTQGRTMIIDRSVANQTLYNIEISMNDKPCLQPGYLPVSSQDNYPLLNILNYQGCGQYGVDNSASIIETLSFSQVISENRLVDIQSLPLYMEQQGNSNTNLVLRPRISLSSRKECDVIDTQSLIQIREVVYTFKKWIIGGTLLPLLLVIIYGVYLAYLFFNEKRRKFAKKATTHWVSWLAFTACLISVLMYNQTLIAQNNSIETQKNFFIYIGAANCFEDPNISAALGTFEDYIPQGTVSFSKYADGMWWASVSFYVITIVLTMYRTIYENCLR